MKTQDIFPSTIIDEFDFVDEPPIDPIRRIIPNNVIIDDNEIVHLLKDGNIVTMMEWGDMIRWINDNRSILNGKYVISKDRLPIYDFTVVS